MQVSVFVFVRLHGFFKSLSLGKKNGLPMLRHEIWIMQMVDSSEASPIPDKFLQAMISARKCAHEMLRDPSLTCFADVQKVLKANTSLLTAMDPSFRLELCWLADQAEDCFVETMHHSLLKTLPTESVASTMGQSCKKLDDLLSSEACQFSSLRNQNEIKSVRKLIASMLQGVSPEESFKSSGGIFLQVWNQLPYFLRAAIPSSSVPSGFARL